MYYITPNLKGESMTPKRIKQLKNENKRLKKSLIEILSLFDFDKSAFLSVEAVQKVCPDYFVSEANGMNVVRGKN